ncbi:macrolide-efflux protein [Renibacterium salmoninarum ATCC 33209]|uniref:Macrolide-efflux protein n=1 Tax=Renibacterium salmoninarum (strain ATCC 33209 / DSM 20767 / JCM 11484 / NBRC 15589 / NCIMB 2235) TaxID=288705 RepID=A9WQE2_RENSM|nr:macrolide-efflux protein [Renibacterium salmoninarum ATCC 33209]
MLTFTTVLWAVFKLPSIPPEGEVHKAGLRSVVEGLRFVAVRPNIRMTFLVDLCAMVFAMPRALLPALGAVWRGGGEATSGLLLEAIAIGSLLAALFSGPLGRVRKQGLAVGVCITIWGGSIAGVGLALLAAGKHDGAGVSAWLSVVFGLLVLS